MKRQDSYWMTITFEFGFQITVVASSQIRLLDQVARRIGQIHRHYPKCTQIFWITDRG